MFRIAKNEKGFLLLTAMIFLFFCTNILIAAGVAYDSHYRAYNALKIAAIDQTKVVLNSIGTEEDEDENNILVEEE